jgi:hypothetical protein
MVWQIRLIRKRASLERFILMGKSLKGLFIRTTLTLSCVADRFFIAPGFPEQSALVLSHWNMSHP